MTKQDLQEIIDNLKTRHRAEIDAILLEQTSYKKIIQQMVMKCKDFQLQVRDRDIQILELKKFEKLYE